MNIELIILISIKIVDQDGWSAVALYKAKIKQTISKLESAVASLEASIILAKGVGHPIHLGC